MPERCDSPLVFRAFPHRIVADLAELNVISALAGSNEAVIHFEMQIPEGTIQVCDWITVDGDEISEIRSACDARELR